MRLGRQDLAQRASAAAARLRRPNTIVCVVGEFKQGKSSLINALLGQPVCPVDDDLATSAITLVRYGDQASAVVKRKEGDQTVSEPIPIADLHNWVSEVGNPHNGKGVERVEIAFPSPLLKQGLVVVDTPGMGGLGAGHAAATLAFLPFADGLIFASDASAELSAPEVEFLRRATELCPTVLFALTKIDLYPSWQRIMELNRGHFERAGIKIPMVPCSSALRSEALNRKDRALNDLSRVPELVKHLGDDVVTPAKAGAAARSAADATGIIGQVQAGLEEERKVLADPSSGKAALAALEDAKKKIENLRGPGSKWNVLVGDRVADLATTVNYNFRAATRTTSRQMDERIELLTKGSEWDELSRYLQTVVADEVTQVFVDLEKGRSDIRAEVVDLIRDENLELAPEAAFNSDIDVKAMWQGKTLEDTSSRAAKKIFTSTVGTIRGAQGGIYMFGMVGRFLPGAASVILASNPVLLGVGALFGGMGVMDDRKRKIQMRRQAARSQVRQFMDDVQFEVGNQTNNLIKEIQRELRDEFGERLAELLRTYTETANSTQAAAQKSQAERQARGAEVDTSLKSLAAIQAGLQRLVK